MAKMSLRGYAKHRRAQGQPGGTHQAVRKAVQAGRISVGADGLIDSEAADAAWEANTSADHRRGFAALRPVPEPEPAAQEQGPAAAEGGGPAPKLEPEPEEPAAREPIPGAGASFTKVATAEKWIRVQLAKLELDERKGKLISREEVEAGWVRLVTAARNQLLALPSKLHSRAPHLTTEDLALIDALQREALEEIALDNEAGVADDAR